jgi:release factor glutamine methyltransferase
VPRLQLRRPHWKKNSFVTPRFNPEYQHHTRAPATSPTMLPTPDTSHVAYERIYEPAEDSFLLLDTLSAESEVAFLQSHFAAPSATSSPSPPLVVEIGPGSGVVIGFLTAQARAIFGTHAILTAGVDVNRHACAATLATARKACADQRADSSSSTSTSSGTSAHGAFLDAVQGDLTGPLRAGCVDVLVFNPPYVPTAELPALVGVADEQVVAAGALAPTFEEDSYLLSLSYAGGHDGMETTDRLIDELGTVLSPRGCAYILLCAQNKPEEVKGRIRGFGPEWRAETVGASGKKAGWEKLQIVRIWRE